MTSLQECDTTGNTDRPEVENSLNQLGELGKESSLPLPLSVMSAVPAPGEVVKTLGVKLNRLRYGRDLISSHVVLK